MSNGSIFENIGNLLTPRQELFCRLYTQNSFYFWNATLSYAKAYNYDLDVLDDKDGLIEFRDGTIMTVRDYEERDFRGEKLEKLHGIHRDIKKSSRKHMYDNMAAYGSRMISNDKIQARCIELHNEYMKDNIIDARHSEIIRWKDDKTALDGIKEYNKVKGRILAKVDLTSGGKPYNFSSNLEK